MTRWSLGVDESGIIPEGGKATDRKPMVVAGVLVPLARGFDARSLRAKVTRCFPGICYPPHATELHFLSSRVAQTAFAPRPEGTAGDRFDMLSSLLTRARSDERAAAFVGQVDENLARRDGFGPRYVPRFGRHALLAGDRWLEESLSRHDLDAVGAWADHQVSSFLALLEEMRSAGTVTMLAIVDPFDVPKGDDALGFVVDGYVAGLELLLERVVQIVKTAEDTTVEYWSCTRHVHRPDRKPSDYSVGEFEAILARARASLSPEDTITDARFETWPPRAHPSYVQAYHGNCHPAAVIADFVANRAHNVLVPERKVWSRPCGTPWARLRRRLETQTHLPTTSRIHGLSMDARLPLAAVTGARAQAVRDAWATSEPVPKYGTPDDWRDAVTNAWIEARSWK